MTADRVAEVWALLVNPEDGAGRVARLRVVVRPGGGEVRAPASSAIGPEVLESCRRAALLVLGAEQTRRTVDWELELDDGRPVELHGRSLTAAFAAALCAASAGVRAPEDVAITGDMDLSGALRPVGGLPTKARAAWARGMRVVAPAAGEEAAPSGGPIQLVADLPALRRALWPDAPELATARTGGTAQAARPRWRERWVWGVLAGAGVILLVWLWPRTEEPAPDVALEDTMEAQRMPVAPSPQEPPPVHFATPARSPVVEASPPQIEVASPASLPPELTVCVLRNGVPLVGQEIYEGDTLRLDVRAPGPGRLDVQSVSPTGDRVNVFPMEGESGWIVGAQLVPPPELDALMVTPPPGEERLTVRWRPEDKGVTSRGVGRGLRGEGCVSARWLEEEDEIVVTLLLMQVATASPLAAKVAPTERPQSAGP